MKTLVVLLLCLVPAVVHAQTPPTPVTASSGISFTDADNAALNFNGSPVIAYYEMRFIPGQNCQAVPPVNLGKPAADVQGVITAVPIPAFGQLTGNCVYTLFLAAIGPGGEGVSLPSLPFVRLVPRIPAGPSVPVVLP